MKSFVFVVPGQLREFADGREEVRVSGHARSVSEALELLWSRHPGIRDRLITEQGDLRPHVNIFVDGDNVRHAGGLDAPVRDGSEIVILPAVSGGAARSSSPFHVEARPAIRVSRFASAAPARASRPC